MKHIKTFEKLHPLDINPKKIDKDYIRSVFSDFIDDGATIEITDDPREDDTVCRIMICNPLGTMQTSLDNIIKTSEKHTETLLDIKSCVGKVRDELPGLNVEIDYYRNPVYIIVKFSI
jgi:hypothetical protein